MFLIDYPFVSDFLIDSIKKNNFKIVATKEAKELILDDSLNWISEEKALSIIKDNPNTSVYSNSENAIAWVIKNLGTSPLLNKIQL